MSTSSKSETPARNSLLKGGQYNSPYKTPIDSSGHYYSNPSLNNTAGSNLAQILQGQIIDESVEVMDDDLMDNLNLVNKSKSLLVSSVRPKKATDSE